MTASKDYVRCNANLGMAIERVVERLQQLAGGLYQPSALLPQAMTHLVNQIIEVAVREITGRTAESD